MEKHWKSVIPRSICDYFFDAQRKANNNEDIPPVITTPHHYLISVLRSNLFFIAVCMTEGKGILWDRVIFVIFLVRRLFLHATYDKVFLTKRNVVLQFLLCL